MARRTVLPLTMALVAAAAVSLGPGGRAGAADMAGVIVRDSSYTPADQTIRPGDTVVFARARDARLPHSVTSDTGNFDQELGDQQYVGLRFHQPGTYAYHCKYHGSAGGGGMSGTIVVDDAPATTSTTAATGPEPTTTTTTTPTTTTTTTTTAPTGPTGPTGPTTTTTAPTTTTTTATTTTTKPPKPTTTTTRPPTTTTTRPAPPTTLPPPPGGGPANSPPGAGSPPPATSPDPPRQTIPHSSGTAPAGRTDAGSAPNRTRGADNRSDAGKPAAPPTTDATAAPGAAFQPDQAAIDAAAAAIAALAAPPPDAAPATSPPPVEPIDPAILETLAAARGEKPPDDGSGLLLGAGIALAMFLLAGALWAFYHRSSRYMPA